MDFTQDNRNIAIDTPLGPDMLMLRGFSGTEGISMPFSYELDLVSEKPIPFADIIGKNVTITLLLADDELRYFNGIISRFAINREGSERDLINYTATMVPWFWLLSRTSDSRIFQNLSIPDIVEQIFMDQGFSDYKLALQDSYEPREYCVQYRETDMNFVSRLLEQEGIFYFFEHEDGKHTLNIADSPDANLPCPNQKTARYHVLSGGERPDEDVVTGFDPVQEIRIGMTTLSDFNFTIPNTDMKVSADSILNLGPGERELYDYPAEFVTRSEGEKLVIKRMQSEEVKITTIHGESVCRAFASGYRFEIEELVDLDDYDAKSYVLTTVTHEASEPVGASGNGGGYTYANGFTCIPHEVPFRPAFSTPKPMIGGVQTAIVVGPSGEEIYTDEYGRVKVQFHWDREGKNDENSSCWIRVSQVWAGAGWGAMYIPRIGHEVIVDFIEGDPDRPIITGRVYQANNMPPYPLPGEKTKSTIKSDSSLGGGGSNEFRFEDKKGSEEIYLHGQKDWTIAIENDKNQTIGHDETLSVGNDRTKTVGNNQSEAIGVNKTIKVGANHKEAIGANMNLTVGVNQTDTVAVAKAVTVGAAYQITVGAAMNETVGAAKAEEIGVDKAVLVGKNSSEKIGASKSVSAGKDVSVDAGKNVAVNAGAKMSYTSKDDFLIKGDKKGVIEVKDQLTIKIGKASITLKKNGDIVIKGKNINTKGSGKIVMKGKKILEN